MKKIFILLFISTLFSSCGSDKKLPAFVLKNMLEDFVNNLYIGISEGIHNIDRDNLPSTVKFSCEKGHGFLTFVSEDKPSSIELKNCMYNVNVNDCSTTKEVTLNGNLLYMFIDAEYDEPEVMVLTSEDLEVKVNDNSYGPSSLDVEIMGTYYFLEFSNTYKHDILGYSLDEVKEFSKKDMCEELK